MWHHRQHEQALGYHIQYCENRQSIIDWTHLSWSSMVSALSSLREAIWNQLRPLARGVSFFRFDSVLILHGDWGENLAKWNAIHKLNALVNIIRHWLTRQVTRALQASYMPVSHDLGLSACRSSTRFGVDDDAKWVWSHGSGAEPFLDISCERKRISFPVSPQKETVVRVASIKSALNFSAAAGNQKVLKCLPLPEYHKRLRSAVVAFAQIW